MRQAQGQSEIARSALLPNVSGYLAETLQQANLAAEGLRIHIPIPGFNFPTIVGPYNNIDLRGNVTQSVVDLTAWDNFRASSERFTPLSSPPAMRATPSSSRSAASISRSSQPRSGSPPPMRSSIPQPLSTIRRCRSGSRTAPQIDVDRSEVEQLTQQQRVISLETELAKEKIALARIIGLPPGDAYDLTDEVPFAAAPQLNLDDAIHQALDRRADIKAAEAQVRAAQHALSAARDERLPSLSVNGNYGSIGTNPAQASATFSAAATLNIPIWQGGRAEGDIKPRLRSRSARPSSKT